MFIDMTESMDNNEEKNPVEEPQSTGLIQPVEIDHEMRSAYIDYSMSVIVSRALPDARDGLKPVQRRVLYGMNEMGVKYTGQTKKSARIVGDVMGKYHPHGDSSVYDAMVRLGQWWNQRYPLVWGQGNFGSMDGDSPAAMRYTEAKLEKMSEDVLADMAHESRNGLSSRQIGLSRMPWASTFPLWRMRRHITGVISVILSGALRTKPMLSLEQTSTRPKK